MDKEIKIIIVIVFHMLKKLEARLNMISRDIKDIKEMQIKFLEMNTTMSEMKKSPDMINGRLDTEEENFSKIEDIEIKTIQNETNRGKKDWN